MSDLTTQHTVRTNRAGAVVEVSASYTEATAAHALAALDEAAAKVRALIDREMPCVTFDPTASPEFPAALIDDDGDRWEHVGGGRYSFSHYPVKDLEGVRAFAGIRREIP